MEAARKIEWEEEPEPAQNQSELVIKSAIEALAQAIVRREQGDYLYNLSLLGHLAAGDWGVFEFCLDD